MASVCPEARSVAQALSDTTQNNSYWRADSLYSALMSA
jgi:hypothetical protein